MSNQHHQLVGLLINPGQVRVVKRKGFCARCSKSTKLNIHSNCTFKVDPSKMKTIKGR